MTDLTAHEARRMPTANEWLDWMADPEKNMGLADRGIAARTIREKLGHYEMLIGEADAELAASRALVEQMREALREEVKKRHHYTDGSQPDDAWLDAKIAEMYPALAAVPDPEREVVCRASVGLECLAPHCPCGVVATDGKRLGSGNDQEWGGFDYGGPAFPAVPDPEARGTFIGGSSLLDPAAVPDPQEPGDV